jgi:hypothetical protein
VPLVAVRLVPVLPGHMGVQASGLAVVLAWYMDGHSGSLKLLMQTSYAA